MRIALRTTRRNLLCLWLCVVMAPLAHAADDALQKCAAIGNDSERLKCYDSIAGHAAPAGTPTASQHAANANNNTAGNTDASPAEDEGLANLVTLQNDKDSAPPRHSYLTKAWDLGGFSDSDQANKLSPLRPYRQSYLIVRESDKPNTLPYSPAPGHTATTAAPLDDIEAKFQFSFKGEIMRYRTLHFLGFKDFRLWGAYTQQSNWQAFNTRNSSPFRETNYEPELIATFGTGKDNGLKLVNIGLEHQSNGQNLPLSRSWNRLYLQGGWEWNNKFSLLARGWWRIPDSPQQDDNPDILNYVGRAEAVLRWEPNNNQIVSLLLRNNLNLGQNRGFAQLDWTTPIQFGKFARLFVQATDGFGESLIDYNHRQRTFGVGIVFKDW